MNFKEILELIDKVADSGIGAVEVEQAGTKLRIEGKPAQQQHVIAWSSEQRSEGPQFPSLNRPSVPAIEAPRTETAQREAESDTGLHIITSPIVGTFYRSPNPEANVFINVGDRITRGKVLCIIEAMKLMNEIESDVEGVITAVYPQNGQPVEYGEKLFAVKV